MERSIFNLTNDELESIVVNDAFPEGITLAGMEERDDYNRLFRLRNNPRMLANILLKERTHKGKVAEGQGIKEKRLNIKTLELELKKAKLENTTTSFQRVFSRLEEINFKLDVLIRKVERLSPQS